MFKIKRFIGKIIKVIRFLPLAWQDEDWDFDYLINLILWKLKNMRHYFNEYSHHAKVVKEIEEVLVNIEDYEDYITAYQRDNELPTDTVFVSVPLEDGCSRLVDIDKNTGNPLTEEQEEKIGMYYKYLDKFQQEKWNRIWDIIKDKAQGWWD